MGSPTTAQVIITENDVFAAPAIDSATADQAQINLPFNFQVTAANNPATYSASGLPPGLTLNSTSGFISGKPVRAGVFPVTLTATNASGTDTATLKLTLVAPHVSIAAKGPGSAVAGGRNGVAIVTRTGKTTLPLTVYYHARGSAKPGVDYHALTGKVTIPAGAVRAPIEIQAKDGLPDDSLLKVKLIVQRPANGSYVVGTARTAITLIPQ